MHMTTQIYPTSSVSTPWRTMPCLYEKDSEDDYYKIRLTRDWSCDFSVWILLVL